MSDLPPPPAPPSWPDGVLPIEAELAGIGPRFVARLIDGLTLAVVLVPLLFISGVDSSLENSDGDLVIPLWFDVALLAVSALYEITMLTLRGQTIGKIAMRIKVVRESDRKLPTPGQAAIRHLFPTAVALVPIPFVSLLSVVIYLAALWDPMRRGWHDRAAGTIVVRAVTR